MTTDVRISLAKIAQSFIYVTIKIPRVVPCVRRFNRSSNPSWSRPPTRMGQRINLREINRSVARDQHGGYNDVLDTHRIILVTPRSLSKFCYFFYIFFARNPKKKRKKKKESTIRKYFKTKFCIGISYRIRVRFYKKYYYFTK